MDPPAGTRPARGRSDVRRAGRQPPEPDVRETSSTLLSAFSPSRSTAVISNLERPRWNCIATTTPPRTSNAATTTGERRWRSAGPRGGRERTADQDEDDGQDRHGEAMRRQDRDVDRHQRQDHGRQHPPGCAVPRARASTSATTKSASSQPPRAIAVKKLERDEPGGRSPQPHSGRTRHVPAVAQHAPEVEDLPAREHDRSARDTRGRTRVRSAAPMPTSGAL